MNPPTSLKQRIADLSPEARAELEQRLLGRRAKASAGISARPAGAPTTLSFAQKRFWFLAQLTPGSAAYNVPGALRLSGALNVAALERALTTIIGRHQVLRTRILTVRGQPVAGVAKRGPVSLPITDFSATTPCGQEVALEQALREASAAPFAFATDTMLRCRLFRLGPAEHVLFHVAHHAAWDLVSRGIFYRELGELYDSYTRGATDPHPDLPIQYADFAYWQTHKLNGVELDRLSEFWRARLADAPPTLPLRTDKPRPALQTLTGAKVSLRLDPGDLCLCSVVAARLRATPFMTLLAAFGVFLWRESGCPDLCVGSPVSERDHAETAGLIGCFINTLVWRLQVDPQQPFAAFLHHVRQQTLDAMAHKALPFEHLVTVARPQRSASRMALFQVNFRVHTAPPVVPSLPGIAVTQVEVPDNGTAKFDLAFDIAAYAAGAGTIEYNGDLFFGTTVAGLADRYAQAVHEVLQHPDVPLGELSP